MNDISRIIIRLVHLVNEFYGCVKAAYTFDAGPNAVIYTLDKDVEMLLSVMSKYFPPMSANASEYCNDETALRSAMQRQGALPGDLLSSLQRCGRVPVPGDVKYIFVTRPGSGPINVGMGHALLDPATGQPVPPRPEHRQLKVGTVSVPATPKSVAPRPVVPPPQAPPAPPAPASPFQPQFLLLMTFGMLIPSLLAKK
jgi:hypothetical protein